MVYIINHRNFLFPNPLLSPSPPDKIKDLLIAKIAMQCSDLYADAYSSMQVGSVKQIWDKVIVSPSTSSG